MMINDADLLKMLMLKNVAGTPAEIMEEFYSYKKHFMEKSDEGEAEACVSAPEAAPAVKKLTKRGLKFPAEGSITDTTITCRICGKVCKRISAAHLAKHCTTPAEYRKVCGYDPKQPLMGNVVYEGLMTAVKRAQTMRGKSQAKA